MALVVTWLGFVYFVYLGTVNDNQAFWWELMFFYAFMYDIFG
jgi:hypothetical protein